MHSWTAPKSRLTQTKKLAQIVAIVFPNGDTRQSGYHILLAVQESKRGSADNLPVPQSWPYTNVNLSDEHSGSEQFRAISSLSSGLWTTVVLVFLTLSAPFFYDSSNPPTPTAGPSYPSSKQQQQNKNVEAPSPSGHPAVPRAAEQVPLKLRRQQQQQRQQQRRPRR